MDASVFSQILQEVVSSVPGAIGAVFIDWEGEAVDEFATSTDTDIRLTGAQWGIAYYLLRDLCSKHQLGATKELWLRFHGQQVVIRRVTDDYLVVLALRSDANLGRALQRVRLAEHRLRLHM